MSSKPLLLRGCTDTSADLYYSVPVTIGDPILYAEIDSRKVVVTSVLDRDRVLGLGLEIEVLDPVDFGGDQLIRDGINPLDVSREIAVRVCQEIGIKAADVPPNFPLAFGDYMRSKGIELNVDDARFSDRRRVKTPLQIAGMRRAQHAADEAMAVAARMICELPAGLTSEQVREAMQEVCARHDTELADDAIVSWGPQSALGHESGYGVVERGAPVIVDIWPRDKQSRCFADMTRTFVAGGGQPPAELAEYWELCRESLDLATAAVRSGAACFDLFKLSCEPFAAAGQPTQLSKKPGEMLDRGFFHGLGHGIGLEVHEAPHVGLANDRLVAGDVITIEPGCYRPGFGGCRLEDLVLVTENGYEILTNFPYEMSLS